MYVCRGGDRLTIEVASCRPHRSFPFPFLSTVITGWEHGTETCASNLPQRLGILNIVADFLEIVMLVLGMFL